VWHHSPPTVRCSECEFGAEKINFRKNQFRDVNSHILTFLTMNFTVWSHIPSTGGDAVSLVRQNKQHRA